MTTELVAFLADEEVGRLRRDAKGRLLFVYDDGFRRAEGAYPLSLSMPLVAQEHAHAIVEPYLWGLLPDNELILDRWAKRFHVSARSAFGLLAHVGDDLAGAVRFVASDRVDALAAGSPGHIDWLTESDIAERLRALLIDPSTWRAPTDEGQFSLGGAQPKTAFAFDGKRWGVPSGRRPTTHIFKPGAPHLDGHAENEHFCLDLAREAGMPAAHSRVERFEDQVAIVVERYDRIRRGRGPVMRVHQEDMCQALGVPPIRKYESEGGPGPRAIVELLREHSSVPGEDVAAFVDALAFNWIIGGTDAHAKNYSLLIGAAGRVRLAPLYDVASMLPYATLRMRKLKLAMNIGGTYRLHDVGVHQWQKLAGELRLDRDALMARLLTMSDALPDRASGVLARAKREGLVHPTLNEMTSLIQARTRTLSTALRGRPAPRSR